MLERKREKEVKGKGGREGKEGREGMKRKKVPFSVFTNTSLHTSFDFSIILCHSLQTSCILVSKEILGNPLKICDQQNPIPL